MSFSPKWAALAVALASIAFLVGVVPAGAAIVQQEVNGDQLTVTADGENDDITLSVVNGNIAVNGVETDPAIPADGDAEIVVNSGGGNDSVDAGALVAGTYKSLVLSGGDGDDALTGGANGGVGGINDVLNGGAGNDTLTGGKGADTVSGGEGDDLMVWNNGDGSDLNDGDAGIDTVESNGAPVGETYTYEVAPNDRVLFKRIAGAPIFTIDLSAENLLVNSVGGDDTFAQEGVGVLATLLTVNAGDGNDSVKGSEGNDTLNGDAGNDVLTGGKGADTANGGEGDDLMVWNNGDGSDKNDGNAGTDTVESNGNANAEVYSYKAEGDRVLFARTSAGAFTIDLSAERLVVNGLAGDDTFAQEGVGVLATLLTVNAGDGNDSVKGSEGNDTLNGDAGNDTLTGGKGADTVSGGEGDDLMVWNNGDGSDKNDGNAGTDTVESNGNANAEVYSYKAEGDRVLFARTSAGAFTIDLSAERLVVNGLAGDDTFAQEGVGVLATLLTVNAGDGNDSVKGSEGNDTLNGDAGNDVLTGGKGADTVSGGEGDDLMVWNNADGSDTNVGGDGIDTTESNGNDNPESYTYRPGGGGGQVLFNRIGAGAFEIRLIAEKLVVNGLKGDDTFAATAPDLADRTLITVNAGDGNDTVGGGDGADVLNGDDPLGEPGTDTLNGGDGADVLTGGKGADNVSGGGDDDLMVWNNGDGSDTNVGGDGIDTTESNGNANAEEYTYAPGPDDGQVLFNRIGAGAFEIKLIAERLVVNGLAGNDTFTATAPGLAGRTLITVNAGDGTDTVGGGDGNDRLVGGRETDDVDGGAGDDLMVWNNGDGSDVNDGGDGTDTVESNGAEVAEKYTYKAGPNDRVLFKRIEGAPDFTIDFTAEKLLVRSLGGDDKFEQVGAGLLAPLTAITIEAGPGNDTIKGSDGDDTMVWNNGDGSDKNDGEAGVDTVRSNGNPNAEVYSYKAEGDRVLFARAANAQGAGAFTIDLSAENLVVNSLAGDDTFAQEGVGVLATLLTVNAGEGVDNVRGSEGVDTLNGDAGNDTLVGGKGTDTANGGEGNDVMIWNNGDGTDVNNGGDGDRRRSPGQRKRGCGRRQHLQARPG